jgi:hypothetical protein
MEKPPVPLMRAERAVRGRQRAPLPIHGEAETEPARVPGPATETVGVSLQSLKLS